MVEPKTLLLLLQHTYSPNNEERKQSEQQLKKFERVEGFCQALIQVIVSPHVDSALRLSAAILFKKLIRGNWILMDSDEIEDVEQYVISDQDKQTIKQNIIEMIILVDHKIRAQLGIALKHIVIYDYPKKWPELLQKIMHYIKDTQKTEGCLEALRLTIKKYEYIPPGKKRNPLNHIINASFPVLQQIFQALLPHNSPQAGLMMKTIAKIFWSVNNYGVPSYVKDEKNFFVWVNLLLQLFEKPIPDSKEPSEAHHNVWWKCKKWVAEIFSRLYSRHCDIEDQDTSEGKEFAKIFVKKYAPKMLEAFLKCLNSRRNGVFLTKQVTYSAMFFINSVVRHNNMYKYLKPHVDYLFQEIIFPLFCFNDEDSNLWETDQQEFVRLQFDIFEEFHSPRTAAANLIVDLARLRGKNHLNSMIQFIIQHLQHYNNSPPDQKNYRVKYGTLMVIGTLCDKLMRSPHYSSQLENMMASHVFPEFKNPHGYLRQKACWVFAQFWDLNYTDPQIFLNGFRMVLNCMKDRELPVKVEAALSIRWLIKKEAAKDEIRKILPQILDAFFKIMNDIDSDELVGTLEHLIENYEQEMIPYCLTLCAKLAENFLRMAGNSTEEDDESNIAAFECIGTLQTLLNSIPRDSPLWLQIEEILFPMIIKILDEIHDFVEECLKVVTFITYSSPIISDRMWTLIPKFYELFEESFDIIDDLLNPLDNYISKGADVFYSSPHLQIILKMYNKLLNDENVLDENVGTGCKVIEIVLLYGKGKLDSHIFKIIETAVFRFDITKKTFLKVLLIEVVINSLYYNPILTLQYLETKGWTSHLFNSWLQLLPKFYRQHDKKLSILTLSILLGMPNSLPNSVKGGLGQILKSTIKLIIDLSLQKADDEQRLKEEAEIKNQQEEYTDDLFTDQAELNENEEDEGGELIELANQAAKHYQDDEEDFEYEEEEISEDDSSIGEEEGDWETPLDTINEYVFFAENMKSFSSQNSILFNQIFASLDSESQKTYQEIICEANNPN